MWYGYDANVTFAIDSGFIPSGVFLDSASGWLHGTIDLGEAGIYDPVYSITNSAGSALAGHNITVANLQGPAWLTESGDFWLLESRSGVWSLSS